MAQPEASRAPAHDNDRDSTGLDALREQIDAVDRAILEALNERAKLVLEVGRLKHGDGASVYEPARERHIIDVLTRANAGPFPDAGLGPVFREIISATRSLEDPVRVAFMGPEGTFSHQAGLRHFGALGRLHSVRTIRDVFAEVETGRSELGIVPVENTTEGVVTQTLDAFAEFDVQICAESLLPVSLDLFSQSGRREAIARVASHPQPLAQSRRWREEYLPGMAVVETPSTAAAAVLASEDVSVAAIGSSVAGEVHGLRAIATGIEDRSDNTTRFLVIGRSQPSRSGKDLTSVVFTIRKDQPGALHRLIEPIAAHGVNITTIQLRPMKGKPWEYLFFLDLEGHRDDPEVTAALEATSDVALSTRVLGSFPRAEGDA
jgi:chorismate mutase/prephenate dehydratase